MWPDLINGGVELVSGTVAWVVLAMQIKFNQAVKEMTHD